MSNAAGEPLPPWLAPLLLPQELRDSDRYAIDERGIPGITLMERAGAALADAARQEVPQGPIVVLCGPGNNGGDGLVAARLLHRDGRDVRVVTTGTDGYRGDAAIAYERLTDVPCFAMDELPAALAGAGGVVDALLGTGAAGAPRGAVEAAINAVNGCDLPVVACDIPSGADAATGSVPGAVLTARCTVTFHRPSPGHVIHPAKRHVGRLRVVDIGIPSGAATTPRHGTIRAAVTGALATRGAATHKYSAGAVVVVAGSPQYPGASVLAVRGAQRAGAGYVTAVVADAAVALVRQSSPEAIVQAWPRPGETDEFAALLRGRADAVVVGPGLAGTHASSLVQLALAAGQPTVLDAGGLAPFDAQPEALRRPAPLILTPHAGELARLLGITSDDVATQRLACAQEAATRADAVVVLKGDDTIVAAPDGRVAVNTLAAPALATAGTGDVLAGAIGALLASGAEPLLAAAGAVWLHACAGRHAAATFGAADGVVAWDVAEQLPAARHAPA